MNGTALPPPRPPMPSEWGDAILGAVREGFRRQDEQHQRNCRAIERHDSEIKGIRDEMHSLAEKSDRVYDHLLNGAKADADATARLVALEGAIRKKGEEAGKGAGKNAGTRAGLTTGGLATVVILVVAVVLKLAFGIEIPLP